MEHSITPSREELSSLVKSLSDELAKVRGQRDELLKFAETFIRWTDRMFFVKRMPMMDMIEMARKAIAGAK